MPSDVVSTKNPPVRAGWGIAMWKLFQLSVAFGVMCAAIYYDWTPNPYLVGLLAYGAAYVATWILVRLGSRLCGRGPELKYEPSSERLRAAGAHWDTADGFQSVTGSRVGDDPRKFIKVLPKRP